MKPMDWTADVNVAKHKHDKTHMKQSLIELESCDGKRFVLTRPEAACSNLFRVLLAAPSSTADLMHIKYINGSMLARVVEWCKIHPVDLEQSESLLQAAQRGASTEWDKSFLNEMKEEQLLGLLHAANFLDVESLYEAACQTVAKRWESRKVEEIRKQYRIHSDYSLEEEQQMRLLSKRLGLDD